MDHQMDKIMEHELGAGLRLAFVSSRRRVLANPPFKIRTLWLSREFTESLLWGLGFTEALSFLEKSSS